MITFRHLSLHFSKPKQPLILLTTKNLNTNSTLQSTDSTNYQPTLIANNLSNCSNLSHLNQIYANIIRIRMLEFNPAPFNYNNIIRTYTRLNAPIKAIYVFISMLRACSLPDNYTLPIVIKALCQVFDNNLGKQVHCVGVKLGLEKKEFCESGFISLYSKSGDFECAFKMFDENNDRKLGSWNAIISGLSQGGRSKEAISMFLKMLRNGVFYDDVTMVSVISACGSLGDVGLGHQLHKCVYQAKGGEKSDILMLNSLVDMYGKCGRMDLSYKVFCEMEKPNVSSWTSMIVGYAMHGHVNEALEFFRCMGEAGVRPNHVTFVGVLSACVHGGKVREGKKYFNMMKECGILPRLQHYGCMVDLLGRAGLLEESREMIENMPMQANVVIWGCLMGACEKHENVEMGEWVAKHLHELEPWNDGAYVVLSNIYASNGLWEEVERIRRIMKGQRLAKVPAFSLAT